MHSADCDGFGGCGHRKVPILQGHVDNCQSHSCDDRRGDTLEEFEAGDTGTSGPVEVGDS